MRPIALITKDKQGQTIAHRSYVFVPKRCDCKHVTWYSRSLVTWDTPIKARCSSCGQANDLDEFELPRLFSNKKASKKRKR